MKRSPLKPGRGFAASPQQRRAVAGQVCLVCGRSPVDPAHLIPRGVTSVDQDDPLAVVPLCRRDHRAYDDGRLSILEYLEPRFREELAFAVKRVGLLSTLQRVTNERWTPERLDEAV